MGHKMENTNDLAVRATMNSKKILTTIHDDSFLYNSLFKIFSIFVQTLADEDEDEQIAPKVNTNTESSVENQAGDLHIEQQ